MKLLGIGDIHLGRQPSRLAPEQNDVGSDSGNGSATTFAITARNGFEPDRQSAR